MRRRSRTQAFIAIVFINVLADGALLFDLHNLETHRPMTPDPARGFVLRQETRHPDGVFYESTQDRTLYWSLGGLDILVLWASSAVAYVYAPARQRKRSFKL